ncbi:MAG: ATP-binding protein [Desulfobulbaceae bacterium]|nr:MAG: ATP-binding protein [Desulfobulbaceae bacterium]
MREILKIPIKPEGLDEIHQHLERILDPVEVPPKINFKLNLMIEELFVNQVEHGSVEDDSYMTIAIEVGDSTIEIRMEDSGPRFNPLDEPAVDTELPLEKRCQGGLGIHFVKHYADTVSYQRKNGKNIVEITKKFR